MTVCNIKIRAKGKFSVRRCVFRVRKRLGNLDQIENVVGIGFINGICLVISLITGKKRDEYDRINGNIFEILRFLLFSI